MSRIITPQYNKILKTGRSVLPIFNPKQLPYLLLWLDGADFNSMIFNGSNISQWNDKSNEGNNFVQPTATNQPTFVNDVQNGLSSVYFNGIDNYMNSPEFMDAAADYIYFIVFQPPSTIAGSKYLLTNGGTNPAINLSIINNNVNNFRMFTRDAGNNTNDTVVDISPGHSLVTTQTGLNSVKIGINGGAYIENTDTYTPPSYTDASGPHLGASAAPGGFHQNYIDEFIIYSKNLSLFDRAKVDNYLLNKWRL